MRIIKSSNRAKEQKEKLDDLEQKILNAPLSEFMVCELHELMRFNSFRFKDPETGDLDKRRIAWWRERVTHFKSNQP